MFGREPGKHFFLKICHLCSIKFDLENYGSFPEYRKGKKRGCGPNGVKKGEGKVKKKAEETGEQEREEGRLGGVEEQVLSRNNPDCYGRQRGKHGLYEQWQGQVSVLGAPPLQR